MKEYKAHRSTMEKFFDKYSDRDFNMARIQVLNHDLEQQEVYESLQILDEINKENKELIIVDDVDD